jgi:chromosome segregation ATPase
MTNRKIEALQEAAAQKAKNSAERVDKAIEKMIKQAQIISFKSVAQAANVSTAYLYKQENLRSRIEILRNQQKQQPKLKQVSLASDNSKNVIISTLREENKRLRNEIDELRRINESLTGKLYSLQSANDLAERFKLENEKLTHKVKELQQELDNLESKLPQKVTPITKVSGKAKEIPESIQEKLESLEIKLNTTLTKVITTSNEQEVIAALLSVEQYIQQNDVNNICGLVVQAIREKWEPSVSSQKPTHSQNNIALVINTSSQINQDRETLSLEELAEISNIFIDNSND